MTEKQYPKLPDPTAWRSYDNLLKRARYDAVPITSAQPGIYSHTRMFTEDQTRAFADATCAMRAEQAAPAAVAGPSDRIPIEDSIAWQETGTGVERNAVMVSGRTWYRDDHPLLAPTTQAAPQPAAPASQDAEDAARYRYLKKYKTWDSTDVFYWLRCAPADEVDSIIDAARGAQGESNG